MGNSRPRKRKTQQENVVLAEGQDFISNLPEDIRLKILSYLPSRVAVQTGVLSSRWRYAWASIPEVTIRYSDFVSPKGSVEKIQTRFIKFVDVFLYLHNSPIFEFKLEAGSCCEDNYNFSPVFDRWIFHLSRRDGFRELSLHSFSWYFYPLPSILFSCYGLRLLKLHECDIKLPRGFQEFKSMQVLELQGCQISNGDLEKLVSNCPMLDELVFDTERSRFFNPDGHPSLKIHAPKLKKLTIHGRFVSLLLKTPCLVKARVELNEMPPEISGRCKLVEVLGSLSEVEVLGFHHHFPGYLAAGYLPHQLPLSFNKLRTLALDVNLASAQEASLFQLLLQNAPNLQELDLTNRTRDNPLTNPRLWQIEPTVLFMNLRVLELYKFNMSVSEIAFLKFILKFAPSLKQLTLDTKQKEAVVEILKGIPKVSSELQITFK